MHRPGPLRPAWVLALIAGLSALTLAGCGVVKGAGTTSTPTAAGFVLPGTGKPLVTIGDKNFTEQFILGELYYLALRNAGFSVQLNQNIGPIAVTLQQLRTGALGMYPEYINDWNSQVAHQSGPFANSREAYDAGQSYAQAHGMRLLNPTPFSDTEAIGVTFNYAVQHGLTTMRDLGGLGHGVALGGPPQFQTEPSGLSALESAYCFRTSSYKSLELGAQYQALDSGEVRAAEVSTTDAQLATGDYTLLSDPLDVFGWGNVVPVVPAHVLAVEGPAFAKTINEVSALLTTDVIRELNAEVDVQGQDPATVASQFLAENGLG
jgi:osmoprotectant transport system substrate-binding protein